MDENRSKKWISFVEALILKELMQQQEDEAFGEFTQYGAEKRFGLPYPGKEKEDGK